MTGANCCADSVSGCEVASLQGPALSLRSVGGREVLSGLLARLAGGIAPSADASVTVLPAPSGARAVVVGGTAWHVVAADVDPGWVAAAVAHDPIAAPLGARFLTALADRVEAEPGVLDV